jgi:hypothetical protein
MRIDRHCRGCVVVGLERTSEPRGDAEQPEIVSRDHLSEHEPCALVAADRGEHRRIAGDILEHRGLLAVVEEIGKRVRRERVAVGAARVEIDEA